MYYTAIGSALLGAVLVSRALPKTKHSKKTLLGPKTGATYTVEDFAEAGFIVVTAADGSKGTFQRRAASPEGGAGFSWQHGKGRPETLRAIYSDIVGEPPPPAAVGPRAVDPKPSGPRAVPNPKPAQSPKSAPSSRGPYSTPTSVSGRTKANRGTP